METLFLSSNFAKTGLGVCWGELHRWKMWWGERYLAKRDCPLHATLFLVAEMARVLGIYSGKAAEKWAVNIISLTPLNQLVHWGRQKHETSRFWMFWLWKISLPSATHIVATLSTWKADQVNTELLKTYWILSPGGACLGRARLVDFTDLTRSGAGHSLHWEDIDCSISQVQS